MKLTYRSTCYSCITSIGSCDCRPLLVTENCELLHCLSHLIPSISCTTIYVYNRLGNSYSIGYSILSYYYTVCNSIFNWFRITESIPIFFRDRSPIGWFSKRRPNTSCGFKMELRSYSDHPYSILLYLLYLCCWSFPDRTGGYVLGSAGYTACALHLRKITAIMSSVLTTLMTNDINTVNRVKSDTDGDSLWFVSN